MYSSIRFKEHLSHVVRAILGAEMNPNSKTCPAREADAFKWGKSTLTRNLSSTSTSTLSSERQLTPDSEESDPINMADVITVGALRGITDNNLTVEQPVLQCVQLVCDYLLLLLVMLMIRRIKPMASQNGVERFRVVMNDSLNFMQGMLGQREFDSLAITCAIR